MVDHNGAAAAARAGYSAKCARQAAHETLSNPDVMAALREKERVEADRLGMTRQIAIKGLIDAFELAKEKAEPAAMIASMRQIGLMLGFFASERHLVHVNDTSNHGRACFGNMTDAELLGLLQIPPT